MDSAPEDRSATDGSALAAWVQQRDEDALAGLIARYAPLVHGVCRRRLGIGADAEQAAQAAFVVLAHKAGGVRADRLGSWLYGVALRTSRTVERSVARRRRHEREAAMSCSSQPSEPGDDAWSELRPHLDTALEALPEGQRQAVVEHILMGQPLAAVGLRLGISPDAARMRINAALERLRRWFARRGLAASAATLASGMAAEAGAIESSAASINAVLHPTTTVSAIAGKTMTAMSLARLIPAAIAALLLCGCAVFSLDRPRQEEFRGVPVGFAELKPLSWHAMVSDQDGTMRLSEPCRLAVGLDDQQTAAIEAVLNRAYDRFRASLTPAASLVREPDATIVTFSGIGPGLRQLNEELADELADLRLAGLSRAQMRMLGDLVAKDLGQLLPGYERRDKTLDRIVVRRAIVPSGGNLLAGDRPASSVTHVFDRGSHKRGNTAVSSEVLTLLACAGEAVEVPRRPIGGVPPPPKPLHAVSLDGEAVPLAQVVQALASSRWLQIPEDWRSEIRADGHCLPARRISRVARLDRDQAAAVAEVWTGVYTEIRSALQASLIEVEELRPQAWKLRFAGLHERLAGLRDRSPHRLEHLVAAGRLAQDQAAFLEYLGMHQFEELSFAWGSRLEEAVIATHSIIDKGRQQERWWHSIASGNGCGAISAQSIDALRAGDSGLSVGGYGSREGSRSSGSSAGGLPGHLRFLLDLVQRK